MAAASPSSNAPYTLVKIDVPASSSSTPVTPLALSWHNMSVADGSPPTTTTKTSAKATPEARFLLDDVSGEALPGELLAVVGSSRAATSALLAAIAGHASPRVMAGVVCINQQSVPITPAMLGLVPREAPLAPLLTVRDHLTLYAELQRSVQSTSDDRDGRVTEVLRATGLTEVAQSIIGEGMGPLGLSLRDRKMLVLATELLTNPSILLLEEPTAGLDAFAAEAVVCCLQTLARAGHTVVLTATLDQPTSAMFTLFDKLLLLADDAHGERGSGRTVFHGKPVDALAFVQTSGLSCPPLTNPFEFFLHQLANLNDPETFVRVHTLVTAWACKQPDHSIVLGPLPTLEVSPTQASVLPTAQGNSVDTQLRILLRRSLVRVSHDALAIRTRILTLLFIATFFGLIFLRMEVSQLRVQSFGSACFFMSAVLFISNAVPEFDLTSLEAAIALRDHSLKRYHVLSWFLIHNLTQLPFQLLFPIVFLAPVYFLIGFPADAQVFFTFYLFGALLASTGVAVGYCASCVAPRQLLVMAMGIVMIGLSMVFGGPFMNRKTTPVYFLWIQQISPVKYCFHGMLRAFWTHVGTIPCPQGTVCRVPNGLAALTSSVIKPDTFDSDWQILLAINLTLRVFAGLGIWRRANLQ